MSLRDTRAANEMPSGEAVAGFAGGRAVLQAKREAGGHMRFPDHTSYLRYQAARAQVQLRQQFRAARAAAAGPTIATPTAPTSLCVFPGDSEIQISFTAPTDDGGAPITDYEYSLNGGTSWSSTGSASSPVTVSGLSSDGTVYSIQLRAVNSAGGGVASSAVSAAALSNFTPLDVAGLNLWLDSHDTSKVTATSGGVTGWTSRDPSGHIFAKARTGTITYDLPSRINNRPAINFQTPSVQLEKTLNLGPSNQITVFAIVKQTADNNLNSEIFSADPYEHFDLFNETGSGGTDKLEVNVTDEEYPSNTNILNQSTLVSVTVSNTGGSNSTGFINMFVNGVQKITDSDRNLISKPVDRFGGNVINLTLNKLLPWKVSGQGFIGDIGEVITYPSVLSATDRQRVEGYLAWKWGLQDSLPPGHAYESAPPIITVPGAPTGISAVAGNTQATVSFTPPVNNGGASITSYTVTSSPGGITASDSSSSIIITGLTNGTAYTFTVVATNSVGNSLPSAASTAVTPDSVVRQAFTTVGTTTWTVPAGVSSIEYLVVGGGGGGGGAWDTGGGGGGGGGMVKTSTLSVTGGSTVTITVGDGGNGGVASSNGILWPDPSSSRIGVDGSDGEASILSYALTTITSLGGGRGYRRSENASGGAQNSGGIGSTDSTPSTGGDGGAGNVGGVNYPGSGGAGGGYLANGSNGTSSSSVLLTTGGAGRSGLFYSGTFGAGGKGGFGSNTTGPNNNGANSNRPGDAGASNTGNGGEGGSAGVASWASGGKGGSGIVVIKYTL